MKKVHLFLLLVFALNASLKAEEMSLLRIGEETISMSEFSRYFRQANHAQGNDAQTYFQNFLHYKLKVADAHARGMDTLPDFRRQCEALQTSVLKNYFIDDQLADSYYRLWYEQQLNRLSSREWVKIEILTFRLSQHSSAKEDGDAVRIMDGLHGFLRTKNVQLGNLSQLVIDSRVTCENDGSKWVPVNSLVQEIVDKQSTLSRGSFSNPFYSPLGIHIIRLIDRKENLNMEQALPVMKSYMSRLGADAPALKRDMYRRWTAGELRLPDEVALQLKQIYDGLLAVYWDKAFLFKKMSYHPRDLEAYFQLHKANYQWRYPHFKGVVIHCMNRKAASKIKKRLKNLPLNLWEDALKSMERENSRYRTRTESGLFQIGKNPYVDRLVFKCGDFEPLEDLPYTFVLGKRMKDGPEEYRDVQTQVEADYRIQKEKEVFDGLSSRFGVEINQEVLKTVNSCGNN